jgi:hypothetical protein
MMKKVTVAFGVAVALTAMVSAVIAQNGPNTKAHPNTPTDNWQHDMLWSWNDQGRCEPEVQKEVQRLDVTYKTDMYDVCIKPPTVGTGGATPGGSGGRSCLMRNFACDAAKHGFDRKAWEITMATQAHIDWRKGRLQEAGETAVGGFLRTYFKCR